MTQNTHEIGKHRANCVAAITRAAQSEGSGCQSQHEPFRMEVRVLPMLVWAFSDFIRGLVWHRHKDGPKKIRPQRTVITAERIFGHPLPTFEDFQELRREKAKFSRTLRIRVTTSEK